MVSEHKKIVLTQLDGLDALKFRMIKSLLDKELKLTDKMQEDYDIIKISNMLEAKFPKDAGVNKLIEVCKNMPSLENLADKLKEEKEKVQNKNKRKSNGAQRKRKQDEPSTPQPVPAGCEASKTAPSAKKKKQKTTETQGSKKQKLTKMQNELLKSSVTNTQKEDCLHIPPMTPSTKSSNSAIKKRKSKSINTEDSKKINLAWEQDQLPEPSESNNLKTEDCLQTPHKPLPISSSNFLTKKWENSIKNSVDPKINRLSEMSQVAKTSVTSTDLAESQFQTPPKPPQNSPRSSSSKKSKDTITKTQTILKIQEEHHILGLPTTSKYLAVSKPQNPQGLPTAASISLQTPQSSTKAASTTLRTSQGPPEMSYFFLKTPPLTPNFVQASQAPTAALSMGIQVPQVHPVTASSIVQAPQVPPATPSMGIQASQVHPVKASNFVQAAQLLPAMLPMSIKASQVPQETASSGLLVPHMPPSTAPGGILASQVFPKPVSTDLLASQVIPPTTSRNLASSVPKSTILKNQGIRRVQDQAGTRSLALQKSTITVKVLKATDLFEYESAEHSHNEMFHATVATERQFFHVKVFNIKLKEIFTKNNVITISNYTEYKGILVINEASCVSEAGCYQKIEIPNSVIRRANETPKIDDLLKRASGTLVYGLFQLHKKKVNPKNTIYEIQDNTGKMDVVGSGKCHNVQCKEGDKLRLFCFLIRKVDKQLKLVCENHSFIKVTRT